MQKIDQQKKLKVLRGRGGSHAHQAGAKAAIEGDKTSVILGTNAGFSLTFLLGWYGKGEIEEWLLQFNAQIPDG